MKLVIKFETLDELKDRLTEILGTFNKSAVKAEEVIEKAKGKRVAPIPSAVEQVQPAENSIVTVEVSLSDQPTADDVKLAVRDASKRNREAAKAIVDSYAPMASQIPAEKRAEAIAKLEAVQ